MIRKEETCLEKKEHEHDWNFWRKLVIDTPRIVETKGGDSKILCYETTYQVRTCKTCGYMEKEGLFFGEEDYV